MLLKVDTEIVGDQIISELELIDSTRDIREQLSRSVINMQDQAVKEALIGLGWTPPIGDSVGMDIEEAFKVWWYREGSGIAPKENEDLEAFAERVTMIAWLNGAYKERAKNGR